MMLMRLFFFIGIAILPMRLIATLIMVMPTSMTVHSMATMPKYMHDDKKD